MSFTKLYCISFSPVTYHCVCLLAKVAEINISQLHSSFVTIPEKKCRQVHIAHLYFLWHKLYTVLSTCILPYFDENHVRFVIFSQWSITYSMMKHVIPYTYCNLQLKLLIPCWIKCFGNDMTFFNL